ncbi:MAG: ABC transporter permease [Burkholderiales bacterium RIFCSPLOWO2_02_FULL_57_36]|nr:MAG: ABC transporter permease [Burkholderiales bacterium RIFCSPLOWO2_02_FULL_57_36]
MWPAVRKRLLAPLMLMMAGSAFGASEHAAPIRIGMIESMSVPFTYTGVSAARNLEFALALVNARGGVKLPDGMHKLALSIFDDKQNVSESLAQFKQLTNQRIPFMVQGNSSAVALALVNAVNRHNEYVPENRVLFLNYSAIDPALTNEKCNYWYFRFDAHADMRMHALTEVIRDDIQVKRIYLISQDHSLGRQVAKAARKQLAVKRKGIDIVGDEFYPSGKITNFAPYIEKIRASGADAVITGSSGSDLALLVKGAENAGLNLKFYTFFANGLGVPAALGTAGIGRVRTVAEWHPNVGGSIANRSSDLFYAAFRKRYPEPGEDYIHLRMHVMIEMLVAAIEKAGTVEAAAVAKALENANFQNGFHHATMRAADHQLIQPLYVSVMQRSGTDGVRFGNEGSDFGFKTERYIAESATALPSTCRMARPAK